MEQAKHFKKYHGQRKTRMGYENRNTEHRQEYEKKDFEKEEYNTKKGKQKCRDRKTRNIEKATKLKEHQEKSKKIGFTQ